MSLIYEPNYLRQNDMLINEIIFICHPDADFVTLFGAYRQTENGRLRDRDFGCDFSLLTDLLLLAGEDGQQVIRQVAEILGSNRTDPEEPVVVAMEEPLGHPLKISGIQLKMYKPMEQNADGRWVEVADEYYLIDAMKRLSPLEVRAQYFQQHFSELLLALEAAYRQYRRLRKLSFSKKEARKRAGLQDELLYRLAKTHYRMGKAV